MNQVTRRTLKRDTDLAKGLRRRGDKYLATVYVGTDIATGKKTTLSKTFTNKDDAARWLRSTRRDVAADKTTSPGFVRDLLRRWLAQKEWEQDTGDLSQNTLDWYRGAVEGHLLPSPISNKRLRDVTKDDLRRFLSHKREKGSLAKEDAPLGASSLRRLAVVLDSAFSWAVSEGWTTSNPMDGITVSPKMDSARARDLEWTVDTLRTFLEYHQEDRLYPVWRLLAVSGMRRGEVLGLQWADLRATDIGPARVVVRRSRVVVGGRAVVKEPKTAESARSVPIDDDTIAVLEAWRAHQEDERELWGAAWEDGGWVFTRENGTPINPDYLTRRTKEACREADVPVITPHDFRHLVGTLLMEGSVPTKVVSDLLGHSSTTITSEIYQTVRESAAKEAIGRISEQI